MGGAELARGRRRARVGADQKLGAAALGGGGDAGDVGAQQGALKASEAAVVEVGGDRVDGPAQPVPVGAPRKAEPLAGLLGRKALEEADPVGGAVLDAKLLDGLDRVGQINPLLEPLLGRRLAILDLGEDAVGRVGRGLAAIADQVARVTPGDRPQIAGEV